MRQRNTKWRRGVNVSIDPETHRKLKVEAVERGVTLRELIAIMVEYHEKE